MPVLSDRSRERAHARLGARRASALAASAAAVALLAGAAPADARTSLSPSSETGAVAAKPNDPFEWLNRRFYALHRALDHVFLRPAAFIYEKVVPRPLRTGVHNFVANLNEPLVFANDVLQLRFKRAGRTAVRFAANSTFGVGGLVDVAANTGLPHHDNDFGVTLARYGARPGPYIFLPLMGPSNLRDLTGAAVDFVADPFTFAHYSALGAFNATTLVVGGLDQRAEAESDLERIDEMGTDSYATMRSLYTQNRQAEIDDRPIDIQNLPSFDDPPAVSASAAPTMSLAAASAQPAAPAPQTVQPAASAPAPVAPAAAEPPASPPPPADQAPVRP
jgi:phospholipid-binding lipoprotein MlaA